MWFLVSVAKGSKYHEPESQIDNLVLVSDTTDMVITGRSSGGVGYRFEMRKGNDSFVVREFQGPQPPGLLIEKFKGLGQKLGANAIGGEM